MRQDIVAEILTLPIEARVQIVDAIWESTSKVPGALPLAEWQREEPDRRIAELEADPGAGATLDEAFARIRRGP